MIRSRWLVALLLVPAPSVAQTTSLHATSHGQADPWSVPEHEVFELTFEIDRDFGPHANFVDCDFVLDLVSPSGRPWSIDGFYVTTRADGRSIWKARFAPDEVGKWWFAWTWIHVPTGALELGSLAFTCVPGTDPGFLTVAPTDPFAWLHADGSAFAGIGMNADYLFFDTGPRSSAFGTVPVSGEERATIVRAYHRAGFDLIRLRHGSDAFETFCADLPGVPGDGICETFLPEMSMVFDDAARTLKREGFRILFSIFGNTYLEGELPGQLSAENRRLIQYVVARYGAYVDLWELTNEREPGATWEAQAANHVHAVDPYDHPVTTSYYPDPPYAKWPAALDFTSPHWYQTESEFTSDTVVEQNADDWKSNYGAARPVVVGEQGNLICGPNGNMAPIEPCRAWQPASARRMRLRAWTALFEGITLVHWLNGWGTDANGGVYVGLEERRDVQVLRRFADLVMRSDTAPVAVSVSNPSVVRARGLTSPSAGVTAVHVHRFASHTGTAAGLSVQVEVGQGGTAWWLDPGSGALLASTPAPPGLATLAVPPIQVDLALAVFPAPPATDPIARVVVTNSQWDGDLDDDGLDEWGPAHPPHGRAPLELSFDAGGSTDWDGGPVSVLWDFGDGQTSTGPTVTHTFAQNGSYEVVLSVTDDDGATAEQSFMVRAIADPNFDLNDAPFLHPLASVTVFAGEPVLLSPKITDREHENGVWVNQAAANADYSLAGLPPGATFAQLPHAVPNQPFIPRQFLWVPDWDQAGDWPLTFGVKDLGGLEAQPVTLWVHVLDAPEPDVGIEFERTGPAQVGTWTK